MQEQLETLFSQSPGDLWCIPYDATAFEAACTMSKHRVARLVVLATERPIGLVHECDLVQAMALDLDRREILIVALMTPRFAESTARIEDLTSSGPLGEVNKLSLMTGQSAAEVARNVPQNHHAPESIAISCSYCGADNDDAVCDLGVALCSTCYRTWTKEERGTQLSAPTSGAREAYDRARYFAEKALLAEALKLYEWVVLNHPDSQEADRSRMEIYEIAEQVVSPELLLDVALSLARNELEEENASGRG
jgi:CBS domain-containing protein